MSLEHLPINPTARQEMIETDLLTVQGLMLNQINQALRGVFVLTDVLHQCAYQLREVLTVSGCLIFQTLDSQAISASLDRVAIPHSTKVFFNLYEKTYPWLSQGEPLVFSKSQPQCPTPLQNWLTVSNLSAILLVPMFHRQSYYGTISVLATGNKLEWTAQEIQLVQAIANHLAITLYQIELEEYYQAALKEKQSIKSALQGVEERYFALLEIIPDAIFSISRDGLYLDWKSAKKDIIPRQADEIIGKHLHQVLPTEIAGLIWQHTEIAFETKETQTIEYQQWLNRKLHYYEARIIQSGAEEATVIVQNITERVQAQIALQEVNNALSIRVQERTAALREANRFLRCEIVERQRVEGEIRQALAKEKELTELKSRFITIASHEFRTPLTTIQSSAELLEHYGYKWTEDKKITHLHRVQQSVKYMTKLLNDILIVGKAEAGQLKLNREPLDIEKFCINLIEDIQLNDNQNHLILFKYKPTLSQRKKGILENQNHNPTSLSFISQDTSTKYPLQNATSSLLFPHLDQQLIRQILENLLSNSIKYSSAGSTIKLTVYHHEHQAIFEICDQGIGIPEEDTQRLFEAFHRANNVGTIAGTGLGLTIVKKCVDIHEGQIRIQSQVGVGTTFTITLPL